MKHAKRVGLQRRRRCIRVRNAARKFATRPRLAVFRSHKHIYAQVIDDEAGRVLAAAGTNDKELRPAVGYGGNIAAAATVGKAIAERALAAGVKQAYFDRREYKYHGRIAALADAARDAGLDLGAKPEPKPEAAAKKPAGKKDKKEAAPKKEKKKAAT